VTGTVVSYVVNAYGTLVKLYDVAETAPRRGESERQREARLATWEKPGLCEGCAIAVEEQEHRDRLERDRRAACTWAAELFAHPETWAIFDSETSSLDGVILEVAIIDAAGARRRHKL